MPVLFKEISIDMDLSLVQLGTIWGMGGLAGIIAGATRGFSVGFFTLAATMFFFGFFTRTMSLNLHKAAGVWFSGRQLVIANGIVSTGFGFGFMSGAMISDTLLSPMLGGWKNVLFLYGSISMVFGLIWGLTRREPAHNKLSETKTPASFHRAVTDVMRNRSVWRLALTQLCYTGVTIGFIGYLPLYLRGIGWTGVHAAGALTALTGAGMVMAIPLSILAGRLNSKKPIMISTMLISLISLCLLSFVSGPLIWPLIVLVGLFRDGYYAIIATLVVETDGIGAAYAGTATGLVWTLGAFGSFIAPPLGNSFASIDPGLPFMFWGAILIIPLCLFLLMKE